MPGFVDCHTHLIFGGSREDEFIEKIKGKSYLEILEKGGGILNTVEKTRKELQSPEKLLKKILKVLKKMLLWGTTTAEVKSGYGLDKNSEILIPELVKKLNNLQPIELIPTFLGAHAFPKEYQGKKDEYVNLVIEILSEIKTRNLAEYCDVFCEKGAFSIRDTTKILEKAKSLGMKLKLHANQFNNIGAVELGERFGAVSLDHLDYISDAEIKRMAKQKIIGVLLPGVQFHLGISHFAPARTMIEEGVPIALASDFNPGSCPTFSMQMIIALACRMMKMTPAEAINASTINAAHAVNKADEIGNLEIGKKADIIILDIANHERLPYWFGMNLVETVIKKGRIVK